MMKKSFAKLLVLLMVVILTCFIFYSCGEQERPTELTERVEKLTERVDELTEKLNKLTQRIDELMQKSNAAAKAGAWLIVWPETMVQAILDRRVLIYMDPSSPGKIFDEKLASHSKNLAYVLVGAAGATPELSPEGTIILGKEYNSAFLYQPDGTQSSRQYNKIHLVPFGEVVPFKKSAPWLHNILMIFTCS